MEVSQGKRGIVWEERWHPLREEWVIIAAHRQNRPWSGETVRTASTPPPSYDPECYLCPGNLRAGKTCNPSYTSTFVFDNDFPCVSSEAPQEVSEAAPPYRSRRANGYARVICYSPRHDRTLAEMRLDHIAHVVQAWQQQTLDLGSQPEVKYVLCFENMGDVVGVSNPHPHGQVYATNFVFKTTEVMLGAAQRYKGQTGRWLFTDIILAEQRDGRRILYEDAHVIAFVPYFARYAYEVYVAPKRRVSFISDLSDVESESLARALKNVTVRFDNLWQMSFPYVMPLYQAPTDGGHYDMFHFFIALYPPLRRPNVLKFLAGPEIGGGNFLSDTSPEAKAAELRSQPTTHYREMGAAQ